MSDVSYEPINDTPDTPLPPSPGLQQRVENDDEFSKQLQAIERKHPFGVASVLDYFADTLKSTLGKPLDAFEGRLQITDPETGRPTSEAIGSALGVAGFALGGTQFSRTVPGMLGGLKSETIGELPKPSDFHAAESSLKQEALPPPHLETVRNADGSYSVTDTEPSPVKEKMQGLYEDQGIHPAEVAHDAETDPTVKASILSDGGDLPEKYVPPDKADRPLNVVRAEPGQWVRFAEGAYGQYKPSEVWTEREAEVAQQVGQILSTIAPDARAILTGNQRLFGGSTSGMFVPSGKDSPLPSLIAVALHDEGSVVTARHEAVHFLKDSGYFDASEWATLVQAAHDNNWHDEYEIGRRYAGDPPHIQDEEAVAEAFGHFRETGRAPNDIVGRIFDKLKDLFDRIGE